ncbi:hypothetical protein CIPAW_05G009700 [Carya illinoinensis]|uniref:Uncharacterized protein n=1 Tax=Carya illinoinensis TaxID=32201 RepID=A0A8T1QDI9_CARIL|nr:hypothetical protein CIPAW_05G009700 [Carya illinoinensis]
MLTLTMHIVHDVPKHLHDIFLEYHDGHPSIFSKYDPNNNILIVTHYSIDVQDESVMNLTLTVSFENC